MADFPSFCIVSAIFQNGPERNYMFDKAVCDVGHMAGPQTYEFVLLKGKYFKGTAAITDKPVTITTPKTIRTRSQKSQKTCGNQNTTLSNRQWRTRAAGFVWASQKHKVNFLLRVIATAPGGFIVPWLVTIASSKLLLGLLQH